MDSGWDSRQGLMLFILLKYRDYPFFVVQIFSDGTCCLKICYLNIIPVQKFFYTEGKWLMVANGHSFLDHANNVLDAHIGGLYRALQQLSNTAAAHLSLYDSHARILANSLFSSLLVKRTTILLTARLWSRLIILNLYKHALFSHMCIGNFFNWKYFRMVTPIQNLFLTKYFHMKIK